MYTIQLTEAEKVLIQMVFSNLVAEEGQVVKDALKRHPIFGQERPQVENKINKIYIANNILKKVK